jgi:hypothetical protein
VLCDGGKEAERAQSPQLVRAVSAGPVACALCLRWQRSRCAAARALFNLRRGLLLFLWCLSRLELEPSAGDPCLARPVQALCLAALLSLAALPLELGMALEQGITQCLPSVPCDCCLTLLARASMALQYGWTIC